MNTNPPRPTTIKIDQDTKERVRRLAESRQRSPHWLILEAIRASVRVIAQPSEIGRPAEGMEPEYREWVIAFGDSGYVAPYRYEGETALTVAVRRQKEAGYV